MAGERTQGDSVFRVFVEKLGSTTRETFVGNEGEIFYDPTSGTLFVSDGVTLGGKPLNNDSLGDLGDIIGDLPGEKYVELVEILRDLSTDKYDNSGGPIAGPLSVKPTNDTVLIANSTGVFVDGNLDVEPEDLAADLQVANKKYVDSETVKTKVYVESTTIPSDISTLTDLKPPI